MKHKFEEPTLLLFDEVDPVVSVRPPSMGAGTGTFAASCTYEAAVKQNNNRCPLQKCPQYLLKCF